MTIFIAADHRGFELKNKLIQWLKSQGYAVVDCGNTVYNPEDDYPDFVKKVVDEIIAMGGTPGRDPDSTHPPAGGEHWREGKAGQDPSRVGIIICGSGVGVCVAANRHKGIRCALGFNVEQIKHARENDHINVLALPADYLDFEKAKEFVKTFLMTKPIMKEKYLRRIKKLDT